MYRDYRSGKWELFKELLGASLDSGQKVVVFSQYLGMIDIMKHYLEKKSRRLCQAYRFQHRAERHNHQV